MSRSPIARIGLGVVTAGTSELLFKAMEPPVVPKAPPLPQAPTLEKTEVDPTLAKAAKVPGRASTLFYGATQGGQAAQNSSTPIPSASKVLFGS